MPKKLSTNPKAQEARDRKEAQKVNLQQAKQKAKEDAYWAEASKDDGDLRKKENRAEEAEAKRQAEIKKKAELKALYDQEMEGLSSRPSNKARKQDSGKKMTKAQIARKQALEVLAREEELKKKRIATSKYVAPEDQEPLVENINRAEQLRIEEEGILEARNIDDAIGVLSIAQGNTTSIDRHPEKRVKSAYKEFEEKRYPDVKADNPTLKHSQIKQILQKEWKKSPQNPLNQQR